MPPHFAALLCILFILCLFWIDLKNSKSYSKALWIPFVWMFIAGSRFVSQWLNLGPPSIHSADIYMEGSPIDRAVFLFLIAASVMVLLWRRPNFGQIFNNNIWICIFLFFSLISIFWSDYPFVSLKRWVKLIGTVSIALIILSEERPYKSVGVILRRLSYLILPLSILFIKYYPNLGRAYQHGKMMYTGVTLQKNSLGEICLILGIYFCWDIIFNYRECFALRSQHRFLINLMILTMIVYLLYIANSATAIACMFITSSLILISRLPVVTRKPYRIITISISFLIFYGILEISFGITDALIMALGRNQDLTNRVPIWSELIAMVKNPIGGAGYEIFWAGERMTEIWGKIGAHIITAHNGYLDIYLNLGIAGLSLIIISIIAGATKAVKHLGHDYAYGMLRISFIIATILYNWTEASFKPLNNMFILLLVGILEVPNAKHNQARRQIQSIKKILTNNK